MYVILTSFVGTVRAEDSGLIVSSVVDGRKLTKLSWEKIILCSGIALLHTTLLLLDGTQVTLAMLEVTPIVEDFRGDPYIRLNIFDLLDTNRALTNNSVRTSCRCPRNNRWTLLSQPYRSQSGMNKCQWCKQLPWERERQETSLKNSFGLPTKWHLRLTSHESGTGCGRECRRRRRCKQCNFQKKNNNEGLDI